MPSAGAQFSQLHQLLLQLKEVQNQLAHGPRQIKARQRRVSESQEELSRKEAELKEARATADRKNLDLKSKELHLGDLQAKLNAATSNREYNIIRGQMDADRAAKAVLEDEILEALDRVDTIQGQIEQIHEQIQHHEAETRKFAEEFERKAGTLQDREAELKQQITEAEKHLPGEIMEKYRRLVEAHGADALSPADGGVCNNCFVALTAQSKVLLNSGKTLFCFSCGRLLYQSEN